jgi:hypothetical protein
VIGVSDRAILEGILDTTEKTGFGMQSMIHGLVQSPLFLDK